MRLLKIVFSIVFFLILFCLLVIMGLVLFFDPNQIKPWLINEVKKQTGYQLVINGKLGWAFYPQFGVQIDEITVTSPNQSNPFLNLKKVNIGTDIWQFIHREKILRGNVSIAHVKLNSINADNAHININWQDKVLTMQPITATLYGGKLTAVVHGRELSANPKWDGDATLHQIELRGLLNDMNPNSKIKISGASQIHIKATSSGKSKEQILSHLNGKSEFGLNRGKLEGVDLNYLIQTADALINKGTPPVPEKNNETVFNNLSGTASIQNGIVRINELTLVSQNFTTTVQGGISLPAQTIDMRLQAKPVKSIRTQWEVPVIVRGPLSDPNVRLDVDGLKKFIVQQQVDKIKDKVKQKVEEKVKGLSGKPAELLKKWLN